MYKNKFLGSSIKKLPGLKKKGNRVILKSYLIFKEKYLKTHLNETGSH